MTTTDAKKTTPSADEFQDSRMSFGDHLLELRSCLIKSILGVLCAFVITIFFSKHLLVFIISPIATALEVNGFPPEITTLSPPEAFLTYIKVALFSGLILSSPWVFYQMWSFIAAGLHPHEKKYVNTFVPFSASLFVLGGIFFMTIVAPISFNFFISFSSGWQMPEHTVMNSFYKTLLGYHEPDEANPIPATPPNQNHQPTTTPLHQENQEKPDLPTFSFSVQKYFPFIVNINISHPAPSSQQAPPIAPPIEKTDTKPTKKVATSLIRSNFTLEKYISLVLVLSLAFGLAFQMPLAVFLLGRLNLIQLATLRKVRRYVVFGIVIFSALITPPDVFSQVLMSIPMYILYELGILMLVIWPPAGNRYDFSEDE